MKYMIKSEIHSAFVVLLNEYKEQKQLFILLTSCDWCIFVNF